MPIRCLELPIQFSILKIIVFIKKKNTFWHMVLVAPCNKILYDCDDRSGCLRLERRRDAQSFTRVGVLFYEAVWNVVKEVL